MHINAFTNFSQLNAPYINMILSKSTSSLKRFCCCTLRIVIDQDLHRTRTVGLTKNDDIPSDDAAP